LDTDGDNAFVYEIVGSIHSADGVVNLFGAIEGDDDVVEEGGDLFRTFVQEKTCCQKGELNPSVAKKVAERREVVMQQRFAACKHDLSNTKIFDRYAMTF
jgi:hypothetical protein